MTGAVGLLVTFFLWNAAVRWNQRIATERFQVLAERAALAVEREFDLYEDVLQSLGALHTLSSDVRPESFTEFVNKGMTYHRRILGTFGWAPAVSQEERPLYEQAMGSARPGYFIADWNARGQPEPADDRPVYFPISYASPVNTPLAPIGLDLSSMAGAPDDFIRHAYTGRSFIRPLPDFFHGTRGYFMYAPIRIPERGALLLRGMVFALLDPGMLLARAMADLSTGELDVRLNPAEASVHSEEAATPSTGSGFHKVRPYKEALTKVRPYERTAPTKVGPYEEAPRPHRGPYEEMKVVMPVAFGDVGFDVVCRPTEVFFKNTRSLQPLILLISGLAITLLLSLQAHFLKTRADAVQRLVDTRTAELRAARDRLEQEIGRRKELEAEILDIGHREQQRMGHDLHDSLGQTLTGLSFLARALTQRLEAEAPELEPEGRKLAELTREAVAETRRIAHGVSPVDTRPGALSRALHDLAQYTRETLGKDCRLVGTIEPDDEPDHRAAVQLYRIAQEAVNNAIRHGEARRIDVRLERKADGLALEVEDDGKGLPEDAAAQGGMGLKIMRYRADMMGGQLRMEPVDPSGLRVVCILPEVKKRRPKKRNYE